MGFWSRMASAITGKAATGTGASPFDLWEEWTTSGAGVTVNSITSMQQATVLACVSVLSEDVAKLPFQPWRRLANGGKELAKDHFLHHLLRQPNNWQTRLEFIEMMQGALILRGNAYAVILRDWRGIPTSLVPIHPDRVMLFEAPSGEVFYTIMRLGLHEMAVLKEMPVMVPAEDILHLRWLSTWNSLLGASRVHLMREAMGLAMSQERAAARLSGSGARPGGVLQTPNKLSKEAAERIKASWQESHGGWKNTGKTAILEEGLQWNAIGMTSVDAEFLASRRFSLEDIARGFRVPLHKLGVPTEGGGPSLVQQDQEYLNNVLGGYCERWVQKLAMTFDVLSGEDATSAGDIFLAFDYETMFKADIGTRIEAKRKGILGMIYTPNEARRGEDLPDMEHGDKLYQPTNVAPIGFQPSGKETGPGSETTGAPAPGGDGDDVGTPQEAPKANGALH